MGHDQNRKIIQNPVCVPLPNFKYGRSTSTAKCHQAASPNRNDAAGHRKLDILMFQGWLMLKISFFVAHDWDWIRNALERKAMGWMGQKECACEIALQCTWKLWKLSHKLCMTVSECRNFFQKSNTISEFLLFFLPSPTKMKMKWKKRTKKNWSIGPTIFNGDLSHRAPTKSKHLWINGIHEHKERAKCYK